MFVTYLIFLVTLWYLGIACADDTFSLGYRLKLETLPWGGSENDQNKSKSNVCLALDESGSIYGNDWSLILEAAKEAYDGFGDAQIMILSFDHKVTVLCDFGKCQQVNEKGKYKFLEHQQGRGSTATHLALEKCRQELGKQSGPKYIMLFTDGNPDNQKLTEAQAMSAQGEGINIVALGFGSVNEANLLKLTSHTSKASLSAIFGEIKARAMRSSLDIDLFSSVEPTLAINPKGGKFDIKITIQNKETTIPKGVTFTFEEVPRVPTSKFTHITIHSFTLPHDILPRAEYSFNVMATCGLYKGEGAGFGHLPERIKVVVKDKRGPIASTLIHLQSGIFAGRILEIMQTFDMPMNILLAGMKGHGKSYCGTLALAGLGLLNATVDNIFVSCHDPADVTTSIDSPDREHCTTLLDVHEPFRLAEVLGRYVPIRFFDTMGISHNTYQDDFLSNLLQGRVPPGTKGTSSPTDSLLPDGGFKSHIHGVLWVVKADIVKLPRDDPQLKKVREHLGEIRAARIPIIVVVTHLHQIDEALWAKTLAEVTGHLGTAAGQTFPLMALPTESEVRFETKMHVLDILSSTATAIKNHFNLYKPVVASQSSSSQSSSQSSSSQSSSSQSSSSQSSSSQSNSQSNIQSNRSTRTNEQNVDIEDDDFENYLEYARICHEMGIKPTPKGFGLFLQKNSRNKIEPYIVKKEL